MREHLEANYEPRSKLPLGLKDVKLDYFGARYFGSSVGRFMSPDDGDGGSSSPGDPQIWNLYAYVQNNQSRTDDLNRSRCPLETVAASRPAVDSPQPMFREG